MKRVKPLDDFQELVADESSEPSLEAALETISDAFRGEQAWSFVLNRLDSLAANCDAGSVAECSESLFSSGFLGGDKTTYDDPRNSFLDHCLETGRGLPITLCIIAQCVASRLGVASHLVGLPGHVVWSDDASFAERRFFDPFNRGREMTRQQCLSVVSMSGRTGRDDDLAAMSTRSVLVRILNNLARSYRRAGDTHSVSMCVGFRWAMPEIRRLDRPNTLAMVRDLN